MSDQQSKTAIMIIEDHPIMRQGLAQLVGHEPDLEVVCESTGSDGALERLKVPGIDLLLLDLSLPEKNGLELLREIRGFAPRLPVLVVSMHNQAIYADQVLKAGGQGFLTKQSGGDELIVAIRKVLAGEIYLSGALSRQFPCESESSVPDQSLAGIKKLTPRELELLDLIGNGLGNREIAARLGISIKTVEVHRSNIKQKLELGSPSQLTCYAVRWVESHNRL